MIINVLKYLGLVFSGLLTTSLFLRLFHQDLYGITMAISGLALFELGAEAWSHALKEAKHGQRNVVYIALWYCVGASLLSSGAEIIMATGIYKPDFDLGLITLLIVVGALVVNVAGVFLYHLLDPVAVEQNRAMDSEARKVSEFQKQKDRISQLAFAKTSAKVGEIADKAAEELAGMYQSDVVNEVAKANHINVRKPARVRVADNPHGKEVNEDNIFEKWASENVPDEPVKANPKN